MRRSTTRHGTCVETVLPLRPKHEGHDRAHRVAADVLLDGDHQGGAVLERKPRHPPTHTLVVLATDGRPRGRSRPATSIEPETRSSAESGTLHARTPPRTVNPAGMLQRTPGTLVSRHEMEHSALAQSAGSAAISSSPAPLAPSATSLANRSRREEEAGTTGNAARASTRRGAGRRGGAPSGAPLAAGTRPSPP